LETILELKNITKRIKDASGSTKLLFEDFSLNISSIGITSILAPQGAGKSSLLKIIAGHDKDLIGELNDSSNVKLITSNESIFPWLSVRDNIFYNSEIKDESKFYRILQQVGLDGYEDHYPHIDSHGFIFRVALARSLYNDAKLILLDEPFELMKPESRVGNLVLTRRIFEIYKVPMLLATKNISSSVFLSDRVLLLKSNPFQIIDDKLIKFDSDRDESIFRHSVFSNYKLEIEKSIDNHDELHSHQFSN
jgi:ABC-type nitrate/sulfonate/bicarbonate transport system ATPase subunit